MGVNFYSLCMDGMQVHRRVTPALHLPVPIYTPGRTGQRHYDSKSVSCPVLQHSAPARAVIINPDPKIRSPAH